MCIFRCLVYIELYMNKSMKAELGIEDEMWRNSETIENRVLNTIYDLFNPKGGNCAGRTVPKWLKERRSRTPRGLGR